MDPARIHREPDVENLRTDFIGCPSLLTRHAKKKKTKIANSFYSKINDSGAVGLG